MARRILADIDAELLTRLARRTDITAVQRAFFIDDAYRWVCANYVHPQLEGKTSGVQLATSDVITVTAPDVWFFETVKDTKHHRVLEMGDRSVLEDIRKQTGISTRFYWWGSVLYTDRFAAEDTPYTLWYTKNVAEIAAGQSPVTDTLFDPVIIMKAAEIAMGTVRDFKEAAHLAGLVQSYAADFRLPKRMQNLNHHGTGARVRFR